MNYVFTFNRLNSTCISQRQKTSEYDAFFHGLWILMIHKVISLLSEWGHGRICRKQCERLRMISARAYTSWISNINNFGCKPWKKSLVINNIFFSVLIPKLLRLRHLKSKLHTYNVCMFACFFFVKYLPVCLFKVSFFGQCSDQ